MDSDENNKKIGGNRQEARDRAFDALYDEMRARAHRLFGRERTDHTLQPTALVHEAYVRLLEQRNVDWQNKGQILGVAVEMMRRVLYDHARKTRRVKRGSGLKVSLEEWDDKGEIPAEIEYIELHEALERLAEIKPLHAQAICLRFFGRASIDDICEELGKSQAQVKRYLAFAQAWLKTELFDRPRGSAGEARE